MFNDGAFSALTEKDVKDANQIRLEAGQPIRFGADGRARRGARRDGGLEIVDVADAGEDALIVHDPGRARTRVWRSRSRGWPRTRPVRRRSGSSATCSAPVYGREGRVPPEPAGEDELGELLVSGDTWTVS